MSGSVKSTVTDQRSSGARPSPTRRRAQRRGRLLLAGVAAVTVAAAAVAVIALTGRLSLPGLTGIPDLLASTDEPDVLSSRTVESEGADDKPVENVTEKPSTTPVPLPGPLESSGRGSALLGTPDEPFPSLGAPTVGATRAVVTDDGLVLPVVADFGSAWQVHTMCEQLVRIDRDDATPVGAAHIVLDAGHGGTEPGAVGPSGLTEKELNLEVVLRVRQRLERLGATVVLTRGSDHNITTKARGRIADAVAPALFVSVHHNGGGTPGGDTPGTMAFTKAGSDHATRFGGLFFEALQPILESAAAERRAAYQAYVDEVDAYEALVDAYDRSVVARDQALVANGQLPATATTVPSPRDTGAPPKPRLREPTFSTTVPPTASTTVEVPTTVEPPPAFTTEPVAPFSFAGSGNRGVRAWVRADGQDYLSVLRHSGDVPTVLVEYLYLTNPAEEALLMDESFLDAQADALASAIVDYFSTSKRGSGYVADEYDDQPIGGGGSPDGCVEPKLPSIGTAE